MKKLIVLIALIFTTTFSYSQSPTKTYEEWKALADAHMAGNFNYLRHSNMADWLVAPYMAVDIADMYWEAFALINGLTHMWLATGDNAYLDLVLDIVERDIDNAVNMSTANPPPQSSNYQAWDFNAFLAKPNWFGFSGTINLSTYANGVINGTIDPLVYGYGRRTNANGTSAGVYIALDEGMYNRNIANLARVMNHNIGSIGTQTSNNGQTYQQRLDKIVAHLRDHVWARNFENVSVDNNHYARDVYRVNTHMSSHLAMVALCLWSIEGDQKYRTFVEQYLWDFDQIPAGFKQPPYLTSGQGLLDKLEYQSNGDRYWWVAPWDKNVGGAVLQDEGHAVAEAQFLQTCYEEGIGLNPPNGEPAIDLIFMQRMANAFHLGYLKGYNCGDGSNEPSPAYRLDGTGFSYGMQSAIVAYAEYNPNILCYLEQRISAIDLVRIGQLGMTTYVSRVLGVNGDDGPVYTRTGDGVGTDNFPPNVNAKRASPYQIGIGDEYIELGADVTDVEDGASTIATPTSGSVPVDGSNIATTAGTYTLVYSYTDGGGITRSDTLIVEVTDNVNSPPVLTMEFVSITIEEGGVYTRPTYTVTDVEDGTSTTGAVITGDTVDTSTAGVYSEIYTVTDSAGAQTSQVVVVTVAETGVLTPTNIVADRGSKTYYLNVRETDFPGYTIFPLDANPEVVVTFSNSDIVELQPTDQFTYQILALAPGTTTMTITSAVDSNISVQIPVVVVRPTGIVNLLIGQ